MNGTFINFVRQFPDLYDKKYKFYKDKNARINSWETISSTIANNDMYCLHYLTIFPNLRILASECEQRWLVLRNRFVTELRKRKQMLSGSGTSGSTWILLKHDVLGRKKVNSFLETFYSCLKIQFFLRTKGNFSNKEP